MNEPISVFFLKLCTGNGAGAVTPAGSKWGSGAGAEKAQYSWARLFANIIQHGIHLSIRWYLSRISMSLWLPIYVCISLIWIFIEKFSIFREIEFSHGYILPPSLLLQRINSICSLSTLFCTVMVLKCKYLLNDF